MLLNDLLRITPYHQNFAYNCLGYLSFFLLFNYTPFYRLLTPSQLPKDKKVTWYSWYCSFYHSTKSSLVYGLFLLGYLPIHECNMAIIGSMAYGVCDLITMLTHRKQFEKMWKVYIFHHGLMFFSPLYIYYAEPGKVLLITESMAQFYLSEIPVITFALSWFLIKYEMNRGKLFWLTSNLTIVNYFLFRIVNFAYLNKIVWYFCPEAIIPVALLTVLNVFWFLGLCQIHFFGGNNKR